MSLNHIILDNVPNGEQLDVKFGVVQADNINISNATFEDLTVTNNLFVGYDINSQGVINVVGAEPAGHISCDNSSKSKVALFKSKPYLNSTTIGPQSQLQADELVNGMLIFDDVAKTTFTYKTPYNGDLDGYLGLSNQDEYAFRIDITIFATLATGNTYRLECDAASGVSINYAGTYVKVLPHTTGSESTFTFVCVRQSDGTYIIYG